MADTISTGKRIQPTLNGKLTFEPDNNRILMHDGTTYRMIIGLFPDGRIGWLITKEGEDVFDAFT